MKLDIQSNEKYFKSDSIPSGRSAKKFFKQLSENVFEQSYAYYKKSGYLYMPILYNEEMMSSTFSVAIDKITNIHCSEWVFDKKSLKNITRDKESRAMESRAIDFWCSTPNGVHYFIELKHGRYCTSEGKSKGEVVEVVKERLKVLIQQLDDIKRIKPNWSEVTDLPVGIMVVMGWHNKKYKSVDASENTLCDQVYDFFDKRKNLQLLSFTWKIPSEIQEQQKDEEITPWVSILFITNKKK
ncbi:hypothetical protein AGMMS49545_04820 [Betaproteobacteria bacterium]|nr:hypothetical protein AGMMS49545_04820 [Betaproteobacteria bacterium]GHU41131.1 hypothetical protein AGMMS50289_03780 [Betaproteobacteria bacterium]